MASNEENTTNEKTDDVDVDAIVSSFAEETESEESSAEISVFTESGSEEENTSRNGEKLVPTFEKSAPKPFVVRPKGQSKANISKGKRPRVVPLLGYFTGEMLNDITTSKVTSHERQWYDHALRSQLIEKVQRTKNTLVLRIDEMNQKKLLSLVDVYKIFQTDNSPIAITTSSEMSRDALSGILKVEKDSSFITTIFSSLDLQDTMRRTILDVKKLPTCGCGYIYVHPSITFSKHLADPSLLIGKQPGQENLAVVSKIQAMEYLNSLRYFLEIVYESLNS